MEVVGSLASSAQLIVYVFKAAALLSNLYERLKNVPDRIRQDANHVKRLIEIILQIKETRSLHTTLVFAQLEHTIKQAYTLQDLLDSALGQYTHPSLRSRYWKVLKGTKEKRILLALQNLEREKTGLSLCLTVAQSELLHDFQYKVKKTESDMPEQGTSKVAEKLVGGQGNPQSPPSPTPTDPSTEQVLRIEVQTRRGSDAEMGTENRNDTTDDQEENTGSTRRINISIRQATSQKNARQNNGVSGPSSTGTIEVNIEAARADDASIQNNGVVDSSYWSRGGGGAAS
ncbi:hypothetical protein N431DRAFT_490283 [Stipitochalara longipes BDJ]|nr:hypothetical protein N431DRAFT_490283 [Stipitochalara longipes BDJ]